MYKRVRLKDTVKVPLRHLDDVAPERVKRLLQDRLEGRTDGDVGNAVSVVNVNDIGEGTMLSNHPDVYYETDFGTITYDPDMREVVDDIVVEVVESSTFAGISPVDGPLYVSQIFDEYLVHDGESQQLASIESNQTLAVGGEAHAHTVTKSINKHNPCDLEIGFATKRPGLGKYGRLESKYQQNETPAGGN